MNLDLGPREKTIKVQLIHFLPWKAMKRQWKGHTWQTNAIQDHNRSPKAMLGRKWPPLLWTDDFLFNLEQFHSRTFLLTLKKSAANSKLNYFSSKRSRSYIAFSICNKCMKVSPTDLKCNQISSRIAILPLKDPIKCKFNILLNTYISNPLYLQNPIEVIWFHIIIQ